MSDRRRVPIGGAGLDRHPGRGGTERLARRAAAVALLGALIPTGACRPDRPEAGAAAPPEVERGGPSTATTAPAATTASGPATATPASAGERARSEEARARAFLEATNARLKTLWTRWSRAEWVKSTYIVHDSEVLAAEAHEEVMAFTADAIAEAARFDADALEPKTARALHLLKTSLSIPAPRAPDAQRALADITTRLESLYGRGRHCDATGVCRDLGALSATLADPEASSAAKLEAWRNWRTVSGPMRAPYARMVELANQGARQVGFEDVGELWRSGYDMPPDAFEAEVERLWQQVAPLYEQLHCFVRAKLAERYGPDEVDPAGKIPAHLLGNMWAQAWGNIHPLVVPFPEASSLDVTAALKAKPYTELELVRLAERFFTGLGLDPLPDTFWERSMFVKPRDRDVVCHASAWDVTYDNDLRIKMCIEVDYENLVTIHHELGHDYYFMYYHELPVLHQNGAHDGFHEGIGDTLALSVTPEYLHDVGVLPEPPETDEASLINLMLQTALDKIAFLPFGRMIDQWRWDVFSGKVKPEEYNAAWWRLRERYQGIAAPIERSEADFDPGAKYHIPANTPYMRYFLARILQFQFHRALCAAAGHAGPLHTCSIRGSVAAGDKLKAMLSLGASRPWPDALEAMTGERRMDASALLDYFAPLAAWLEGENAGRTCGW